MNRFFDKDDYRRDFPRRAFARLDDLEPIFARTDDELTFVFDAVDADWEGFRTGGPFDLQSGDLLERAEAHWRGNMDRSGFAGPGGYADVPIYRIEFTLPPGHKLFKYFPRSEEPWITLTLTDQETDTPVDVYGGLFAPPVRAFMHAAPEPAPAVPLGTIFDMDTWPDAAKPDLLNALHPQCELEALVCFDVGQGAASALLCKCGKPIYYFDTGMGSGRNAPTAPSRVDFCTCSRPTVILSHWDTDHWAGAASHTKLLAMIWIVPRQTISMTHAAFANDILMAGGTILVVGHRAGPHTWSSANQSYELDRATGSGRNASGLVLIVNDVASRRSWVLTGDAGFDVIPHAVPSDIAAMVVPHHGADMGPSSSSSAYPRSGSAYARLFYSFGRDNSHGPKRPFVRHPVAATLKAHSGWGHGSWSPTSPGESVPGGDTLATSVHSVTGPPALSGRHLDGAAAGWTGAPALGHLASCPDATPVPQS